MRGRLMFLRRRWPTPRGRGRKPFLLMIPLLALVLVIFFLWVQGRMRPQVEQLAAAEVHNLAARAANLAVSETIADMGVSFEDLIRFEKSDDGRITALKANMLLANTLKSEIMIRALEYIHKLAETDIYIPLGGLLNGDLVVGRGPKIPVHLVPVGAVSVEFSNKFTEAGINQTLYQVMITVQTTVSVLIPGSGTEQTEHVEVCIAEAVLLGDVPEMFANWGRSES